MAKLYFKYGVMGSSKTASLLMTKFNYEQNGSKVLVLKSGIDDRDGDNIVKSRIGLSCKAYPIKSVYQLLNSIADNKYDVILVDESQFLKSHIIDALHYIAVNKDIPVICYGLLTDFTTHMFEGSKRLMEVSESISEIKMVCECGKKATVNARIDDNGNIITNGDQILIGGNDKYKAMCYKCWIKALKNN